MPGPTHDPADAREEDYAAVLPPPGRRIMSTLTLLQERFGIARIEAHAYDATVIPDPPVEGSDLYEANAWHNATV